MKDSCHKIVICTTRAFYFISKNRSGEKQYSNIWRNYESSITYSQSVFKEHALNTANNKERTNTGNQKLHILPQNDRYSQCKQQEGDKLVGGKHLSLKVWAERRPFNLFFSLYNFYVCNLAYIIVVIIITVVIADLFFDSLFAYMCMTAPHTKTKAQRRKRARQTK